MGQAVLDTSVLIAFLDDKDAHHGRALRVIEASVGQQQLVAPVLAYAEVMVGLQTAIPAVREAVELFFETYARVEPMTKAIGRRAAELRSRTGVRMVDAAIIATGIELDADEILTADRRWKKIDARVDVV